MGGCNSPPETKRNNKMNKKQIIQRLKWIEESTNDYISSIGGIDNSDQFRMLNDILIACDLNDDEPEKYWDKTKGEK